MFSSEFFKNALFYRRPPVAASSQKKNNEFTILQSSFSSLKKINNILRIFSLLCFAVHNRKLSQEMCFILPVYYKGLCTGCSKKEATVRFFRREL